MITERMQIQLLADRLAGLPVKVKAGELNEPWATCWRVLESSNGTTNQALLEALKDEPERERIVGAILSARPGFSPMFPSLKDIAEDLPPIEWLWPGWIPRGMLTIFGAAQGAGKSFVALDLAWRLIHNKCFPDQKPIPRPGCNVLYVDAEMVPQILNERATNYQIDRGKLYIMMPKAGEMIDFAVDQYKDQMIEMVASLQPELVIVDSLSSIHSRGQNNVEDVRELLGFLTQVAGTFRTGLVLIHHIRKPGTGGVQMLQYDLSMEDLSGSGHITAMARVVMGLHVVQTGPEFDPNGPRELKMLKTNLGPYEKPLGFEFAPLHPEGVFLKWTDKPAHRYQEPTKSDDCSEWLVDMLGAGPMAPKEIVERAEDRGFNRRMVYRAREQLGSRIRSTEGRRSPENEWELVGWDDEANDE